MPTNKDTSKTKKPVKAMSPEERKERDRERKRLYRERKRAEGRSSKPVTAKKPATAKKPVTAKKTSEGKKTEACFQERIRLDLPKPLLEPYKFRDCGDDTEFCHIAVAAATSAATIIADSVGSLAERILASTLRSIFGEGD